MQYRDILALGAGLSLLAAPVARAACLSPNALAAAKLRHLDVMLMVSSLRCRTGADDFQADYDRFVTAHRGALSAANHAILDDFAARIGAVRASAEMDHLSVVIANRYGQGGALGCHELRMVTRDLAESHVAGALTEAADTLVGDAVLDHACAASFADRR